MNPDILEAGSKTLPGVSIVVPVLNEAENIAPLIAEIRSSLATYGPFEIIYVDDGSVDATPDMLKNESENCPELIIVRHSKVLGQSAAIRTGVISARAPVIVTIDGDGQNDPIDIPKMLTTYFQSQDCSHLMVSGHRIKRKDVWLKRISSRIANTVRAILLSDETPDTGCGLKVISREAFLSMPAFDHMHRFLPALMIGQGGRVVSLKVKHRPRMRGQSNYGVFDRLFVGIVDLFGVLWLKRRGLQMRPKYREKPKKDTMP